RIPIDGFDAAQPDRGGRTWGPRRCPTHTCFNQLVLPNYPSYAKLKEAAVHARERRRLPALVTLSARARGWTPLALLFFSAHPSSSLYRLPLPFSSWFSWPPHFLSPCFELGVE
ncbi:unnamed protein product, partial [Heterosigma akashiwo]